MENININEVNQLSVSPTITIVRYMWYNKPYEVVIACKEDCPIVLEKDGVYETSKVTLSDNSLYQVVEDTLQLKSDNSVVIDFKVNTYDFLKLEQFIKDENVVFETVVRYSDLKQELTNTVLELLDLELKGRCQLPCDLIRKRDLLRMTIIAIEYFLELKMYREIQRIIESFFPKITDCDYAGSKVKISY